VYIEGIETQTGDTTMRKVEVNIQKLDSGLYTLSFDGVIRGDGAKFDHREAKIAAASWDGKTNGDWKDGEWVEFMYVCPWGRIGSAA